MSSRWNELLWIFIRRFVNLVRVLFIGPPSPDVCLRGFMSFGFFSICNVDYSIDSIVRTANAMTSNNKNIVKGSEIHSTSAHTTHCTAYVVRVCLSLTVLTQKCYNNNINVFYFYDIMRYAGSTTCVTRILRWHIALSRQQLAYLFSR